MSQDLPVLVEEAIWLWGGGVSPEHIAGRLGVQVESLERAFYRAGVRVPWPPASMPTRSKKKLPKGA